MKSDASARSKAASASEAVLPIVPREVRLAGLRLREAVVLINQGEERERDCCTVGSSLVWLCWCLCFITRPYVEVFFTLCVATMW